ncbi:MAG: extracellular solute-binding protein [Clostridiales bacterium]|nr:extracellular solute-binding protein [Clostridiales bacterium]
MKKTNLTRLIAGFLSFMMLGSSLAVGTYAADDENSSTVSYNIADVRDLLNAESYSDYAIRNANVPKGRSSIKIDAANYNAEQTTAKVEVVKNYNGSTGDALLTPATGTVVWDVDIPSTGKYAVDIEYSFPIDGKSTAIERKLRVDGEYPFKGARYLAITKVWRDQYLTDENGNPAFKTDINGNDIKPQKEISGEWRTYTVSDSTGYDIDPYQIVFEAGKHTISLESARESLVIKSITLYPYEDLPTWEEVQADYAAKGYQPATGANQVIIQAEYPDATSDSTIYPSNDRTSALTQPQSTSLSKLNALGSTKWQTVGQWVEYSFTVEKSGLYEIVPRYKQADLSGMYTSRRIRINGEIPFEEANYLQFDFSDNWQTKALNDGTNTFQFYFEEGKEYTIQFEVVLGGMSEIIGRVQDTLTAINADYLKILQITGADPDDYRDYNFRNLIPDTIKDLYAQYLELTAISELLTEINGQKGSNVAQLDNIARVLRNMATDEDEVAKSMDTLKSYIGTLGTWLNNVRSQPVYFDYIAIQPANEKLPKAEANFFEAAFFEIGSFIMSFFTDYSNLGATIKLEKEDTIEVWTPTGRDQALVIRSMVDNEFTSKTNIGVNLKLVAAGTLLPATLSGTGPDIALSNAQGIPVEYAIRNAVIPLNDFDTFDEVTSRFSSAAMVPVTLYGTTYGLPETQTFNMMFYRKDVFAELEVDIPKTWDDLMSIVPYLQYNNMIVGIPKELAGYQMFLYQMGGEQYADNGMRINFDSNLALEAFDTLCSYFTQYSFPVTYDAANRFRTGEMPIMLADYVAMYNQLSIFATEIRDLWEFVPIIGMEDENGKINNTSISTLTTMIMMNGCKNQQNAWRFMDWYTSADTQSTYANEMVAIVGQGAMYATANKEALQSLPWSTTDLENIMAQYNNLAAIPEMPGGYIITRYVQFAFLSAYNDNKDPVEELLGYVDDINKEITRKRKEFGLDTLELGETLADREANKNNDN